MLKGLSQIRVLLLKKILRSYHNNNQNKNSLTNLLNNNNLQKSLNFYKEISLKNNVFRQNSNNKIKRR